MTLIVCHGESAMSTMHDSLISLRPPRRVVTIDHVWWELAADMGLPRYWFTSKLSMMQFCLGRRTIAMIVKGDKNQKTREMAASMKAMNVLIFNIMPREV